MKTIKLTMLAVLMCSGSQGRLSAQAFNAGSDGSYGVLNVTSNTTLNVPTNGIFNCTRITIAQNMTLRFNRSPLNTPVYLLATDDVTINGVIDVAGKNGSFSPPTGGESGPGGFDGGKPGSGSSVPPGAGYGPGAGKGGDGISSGTATGNVGAGGYGSAGTGGASTNHGGTYGSPLLVPLVGGSGGGGTIGSPGAGGGGGGGAILIGSNTRIDINGLGLITARGGNGGSGSPWHGGSGGAIRLVAPIIAGNGTVRVAGGSFGGGNGRIRIDTLNRSSLALNFDSTSVTTVGSMMFIFPGPVPRLDILEAAGTVIAEGNATPVIVNLPFGSSGNRTVRVQARDFSALVLINVVLTPDSGLPIIYPAQIDNRNNPAEVTVDVVIPVNVQVTINAWTR